MFTISASAHGYMEINVKGNLDVGRLFSVSFVINDWGLYYYQIFGNIISDIFEIAFCNKFNVNYSTRLKMTTQIKQFIWT